MNDHTQRIIQIMQDKKMKATRFAEVIGIQRAAMSHITSGRNNPSADVLTKIINRFPDVNPGWLLTGNGVMKTETKGVSDDINDENNVNRTNRPLDANVKSLKPPERKQDLFDTPILDHTTISTGITDYNLKTISDTNVTNMAVKHQANTPTEEVIRPDFRHSIENHQRDGVNQVNCTTKIIDKEDYMYKERPVKTVDKLIIYFSDKTFETFIPEKN